MMRNARGFTLVELMITIAVVAVLLTLAAPSLYDFILVQRLKSINAQLVTDMQFARSEAISRFQRRSSTSSDVVDVQVSFAPAPEGGTMSCYVIYTDSSTSPRNRCDCTRPAGERCPASTTREIRTVQIPVNLGVRQSLPDNQAHGFSFLSTNGAIRIWPVDLSSDPTNFRVESAIDDNRKLRTTIGLSGRPTVCSPGGAVSGSVSC